MSTNRLRPFALTLTLTLLALSAPGCTFFEGEESGKITEEQMEQVRAGMSIPQVREILGLPWQVVVNILDRSREIHRYRSDGEVYSRLEDRYDPDLETWGKKTIVTRQLQIVELMFADGVLVAEFEPVRGQR